MRFGFDFLERAQDGSVFADDVCAALNPGEFLAKHLFLDEDVVEVGDLFVFVCEQHEWQAVFDFEFHVDFFAVGADADDRCFFLDRVVVVPERAGFFRASWSVIFRVEVEHDFLASVV